MLGAEYKHVTDEMRLIIIFNYTREGKSLIIREFSLGAAFFYNSIYVRCLYGIIITLKKLLKLLAVQLSHRLGNASGTKAAPHTISRGWTLINL